MMFFYRWLNQYTIYWQLTTIYELWNSIIVLNFKTSLVIAPLTPPPRTPLRHYGASRMKIDMWLTPKMFSHKTVYYLNKQVQKKAFENQIWANLTAQKMKFSIQDFFSKCDQIRSFLRIWSHLLKKSLMNNFIFCACLVQQRSS